VANTFVVARSHLILGLCLPLAVLLGFLLAEPQDSASLAVIVAVVSLLCVPLMMRWHHLLLVLCWNAVINLGRLPGRPALWMVMGFLSFFFIVLGRSINPEKKLLHVPGLTRSLLSLLAVVLVTALLTGGVGIKAFGSLSYGGKGYFIIAAAVVGYFALSSQKIPRERAAWYVALFFLSGLTAVVSNLVYMGGSRFYFLYELFPSDLAMGQVSAESGFQNELVRISGLVWASQALYGFLLARYGIQGVFDFSRPWRAVFLLGSVAISLFGGFRTGLVLFGLTFAVLFCVEGLWKTRTLLAVLVLGAIVAGLAVSFVDRMPWSVQRALSFLPINVDPIIKQSAEGSTEWRLDMWRSLWPEVPRYLFRGKGYAIDQRELMLMQDASQRGYGNSNEVAMYAGDYHNGPISVVITFGLYGLAAFLSFLAVAVRVLYHNYRFGDPALHQINAYLLAFFVGRAILFFFIFGAFYGELFYFTGMVGLSVALNHGEARPPAALVSARRLI
jgi:O-antigen ligase